MLLKNNEKIRFYVIFYLFTTEECFIAKFIHFSIPSENLFLNIFSNSFIGIKICKEKLCYLRCTEVIHRNMDMFIQYTVRNQADTKSVSCEKILLIT